MLIFVDFVEEVFKQLDLDYKEYLVSDRDFFGLTTSFIAGNNQAKRI